MFVKHKVTSMKVYVFTFNNSLYIYLGTIFVELRISWLAAGHVYIRASRRPTDIQNWEFELLKTVWDF